MDGQERRGLPAAGGRTAVARDHGGTKPGTDAFKEVRIRRILGAGKRETGVEGEEKSQ